MYYSVWTCAKQQVACLSTFTVCHWNHFQLKHNLQWEASIRDLSVLSRAASFDIRKQSGLTLKSALKHILSVDFRDDTIFPTAGSLFQLTSEVAGIGGDVGFLKNEFHIQGNYSLLEDIVSGIIFGSYSAKYPSRKNTIHNIFLLCILLY